MIKVTLGEATPKNEKPKYPYFGMPVSGSNQTIVLFTKERTGVCVYQHLTGNVLGEYSEGWEEEWFTPIPGPIIFENEF